MRSFVLILSLFISSLSTAQDLVEFENGQVADADVMNQNLILLVQKIEVLEERVAALEPKPLDCNGGKQEFLVGTWAVATTNGSFGVGPYEFDTGWWRNDDGVTALRACYFDDQYVFGNDGSFRNVQDDETWLEPWQGVSPMGCGTPISPHDGSTTATYEYQCEADRITISGTGSYLGLAKAVNGQELASVNETPDSITYNAYLNDDGSLSATIEAGAGVWWSYLLVKSP